MSFPASQPDYAAHKIACFPVDKDSKKPSITHADRIGLRASSQLAIKFPLHDALGFWAGPRNGITVLDVDVPGRDGERLLGEHMDLHGHSKFIVRTPSGKFHAYYRNNSEPRLIKMYGSDGPAVDLLGSGVVVAAPSKMRHGSYQIIQGCMDDLDSLTKLHDLPARKERGLGIRKNEAASVAVAQPVREGERNKALYGYCMEAAKKCKTFDELLALALAFSATGMTVPLPHDEIVTTATSAWGYQQCGKNYFGQKSSDCPKLFLVTTNPDANALYDLLRHYHNDRKEFFVANALMKVFGWKWTKFTSVRKFLIKHEFILELKPATNKAPALYGWGNPKTDATQ